MNDKAHFDAMYAGTTDPWKLRGSWYEQRKRNLLVASLPSSHYHSVFEPACANGELTIALAPISGMLIASDGNAQAVKHVHARVAHLPHVQVRQLWLPDEWPAQKFDLIVLSEFLYYLKPAALELLWKIVKNSLTPDGTVMGCHWRPMIEGCDFSGDEIHQLADKGLALPKVAHYQDADFRMDVWRDCLQSIAQSEGRR